MNSIGFDSIKDRDRDYKGSSSSSKASISDDDVNAFSQLLDRKASGKDEIKDKSRDAIYSDKEEKKAADKNAKNATNLPAQTKMSASKQMLYNMAYMNKSAMSLSQKSAMGLNADGMSKAMLMHSSPNSGLAGKADASAALSQMKGQQAASALKADASKSSKEGAKSSFGGVNANVTAQTSEQQNQVAMKAADKAEKADAARNVKREEVIKQIIDRVELRNFAGKSELTIKMNPEFLGSMKMRLIFEGDKVSAEFNTTSKAVREAIQESEDELAGAFKDKGIKVGKIKVKLVEEERA